jgi:hypothetical protein
LEIALFSDFGTGRYHSRYIARQFEKRKYPYAIHLGDVYYAGRKSEFEEYFIDPLNPILEHSRLFMLNSNHEMYSGGKWYFDFMDRKRRDHAAKQEQEGSYFSLVSDRYQIIGIDTAYHEHGRFPDPALNQWLMERLQDGKSKQRVNILLSADHPYKYGESKVTKLLSKDLNDAARSGLIQLWFWGNTHYCAAFNFEPGKPPFFGCCIGHGGFPYGVERGGKETPAPLLFLETDARFPKATGVRQDMGNNGFCQMRLEHDGQITLDFIDWMSRTRCRLGLIPSSPGGPLGINELRLVFP